jgi:4a-hydroxytetrahydrobiopterin dehydratase
MATTGNSTTTPYLAAKKCLACEERITAIEGEHLSEMLAMVPEWKLSDDGKTISRTFKFADWGGAAQFSDRVATLADQEGHHPDILLSWGRVRVDLSTHRVHGLTENDFILAAKIDQMLEGSDLE